MKHSKFLKTVVFALLLLWSTVNAQSLRTGVEQDPDLIWEKDQGLSIVEFSPDGKWLLTHGVSPRDVVIRDVANGEILKTFPSEITAVFAKFSPDGQIVATCNNEGYVYIWSIAENKIIQTFSDAYSNQLPGAYSLEFSPDGRHLAFGTNYKSFSSPKEPNIFVWDMENKKLLWKERFSDQEAIAQYVVGTPYLYVYNRLHVPNQSGKTGALYEAETGKFIKTVGYNRVYSPDGMYYATFIPTGEDANIDISLHYTDTDKLIVFLPVNQDVLYPISFTPHSRYILFSGRDSIDSPNTQIWEIESGKLIRKLIPYGAYLKVSPDSQYIASTGIVDGKTRLYSANWEPSSIYKQEKEIYNLTARPNPARDQVNISFMLSSPQNVTCSIVSLTGEKIEVLANGGQTLEGPQTLIWYVSPSVAQGAYFVRLDVAGHITTLPITIERGE